MWLWAFRPILSYSTPYFLILLLVWYEDKITVKVIHHHSHILTYCKYQTTTNTTLILFWTESRMRIGNDQNSRDNIFCLTWNVNIAKELEVQYSLELATHEAIIKGNIVKGRCMFHVYCLDIDISISHAITNPPFTLCFEDLCAMSANFNSICLSKKIFLPTLRVILSIRSIQFP